MKCKVNRAWMLSALGPLQAVCSKQNPMPILANALVEFEGEGEAVATMRATDGDVSVTVKVPVAELSGGFRTTFPAKQFATIFKDLGGDEAEWECDEKTHRSTIRVGKARYNIGGMDPAQFPSPPTLAAAGHCLQIGADALRSGLKLTSYAAIKGLDRPMLAGVFMEPGDGGLNFVATDSRRIAVVLRPTVPATSGEKSRGWAVATKTVELLSSMLEGEKPVTIESDDRLASFHWGEGAGEVTVVTRLTQGAYPRWQQVIPDDERFTATIDRQALMTAVRRVTAALCAEAMGGVGLEFDGGTAKVSATANTGAASETLPVEWDGEKASIHFNPPYLLEPLKALSTDKVRLTLAKKDAGMNPGVLQSEEGLQYVLMPIRDK